MLNFYYVLDSENNHVFNNFPSDIIHLISSYQESLKKFTLQTKGENVEGRMAMRETSNGKFYVLSIDAKIITRTKSFKDFIDITIPSLEPLINVYKKIQITHKERNEEFIHNVTSLASYTIQELFSLIPQRSLTGNLVAQKEEIKKIILSKPNVTVETLLHLIKYSLATKVEFSVFERTNKKDIFIQSEQHPVRNIILLVLQIFITDFDDKRIKVEMDSSDRMLNIDYDCLFVSLYYIFENSIKYCCPNSTYKVSFKDLEEEFEVIIEMLSIEIKHDEIEQLTLRGYRSETARQLNTDGKGIGLFRMCKTLEMNNAKLVITPRINDYSRTLKKILFQKNEFKMIFFNQKKWK